MPDTLHTPPSDLVGSLRARVAELGAENAGLREAAPALVTQKRQVFEAAPPPPPQVIEYQVQAKQCPACDDVSVGLAPAGVTGRVQYGLGVHASAAGTLVRAHTVLSYQALLPWNPWRPPARSRGMKLSVVFEPEPAQWGLRGDPHLWRAMRVHLAGTDLPASVADAARVLHDAFSELAGVDLAAEPASSMYREQYAHGGMSSGMICLDAWRQRLMPLLTGRVGALLRA